MTTSVAPGAPKRVVVKGYGFSVEPPARWNTGIGKDGLPLFTNIPWSKLGAQGLLPEGGATINLVAWDELPRRKGDESLLGWAHLDAAPPGLGSRKVDELTVPASTGITDAISVSLDEAVYSPDEQRQHDSSVYWTFRRKKFAAHLFYVVGDPRGAQYEDVLRQVVRSIRPQPAAETPRHGAH